MNLPYSANSSHLLWDLSLKILELFQNCLLDDMLQIFSFRRAYLGIPYSNMNFVTMGMGTHQNSVGEETSTIQHVVKVGWNL